MRRQVKAAAITIGAGIALGGVAVGYAASLGFTSKTVTATTVTATPSAPATSMTCTLQATGDTYYVVTIATTHGTEQSMITNQNATGSHPAYAVVKFDVTSSHCAETGAAIPSRATVNSATLKLTTASASSRTVGVALAGSTWSEATLSGTNASSFMLAPANPSATATLPGTSGGVASWNVKNDVVSLLGGSTDGGWILWDQGSGNAASSFVTREGASASRPSLVVTYS